MQLSGIRVVDLSRIVSGPFCSMFLADMGAEVIKVEGVDDGDPVRKQGIVRDGLLRRDKGVFQSVLGAKRAG